jgi:dipeptidyl aminopeptidase/acylaminoacyl peptidase
VADDAAKISDTSADSEPGTHPDTPFHDLDAYVALPRTGGLAISPDGTRLVTSVATLDPDKTKYVTALWDVDPAGERPAHRLTRSAKGEAAPAFLPSGDLLFTSARPDPERKDDEEKPMLWLLPAAGGEARVVASRPGGIGGLVVARDSGTIVVASNTFPSSVDAEADEAKRKERKERKVSAILHEQYPVRYWDHDLGPDTPRLFAGMLTGADRVELRDLTPDAGPALIEAGYDITPDGTTVVAEWRVAEIGAVRSTLVAIDVATGERRLLVDDEEHEYVAPAVSPDGTLVAAIQEAMTTPSDPPDRKLVLISLADGTMRQLAADWDRWPSSIPRWTPDGATLIVTADDGGRSPIFRVAAESGTVTRLTGDDAAYLDVVVAADGQHVYALRTSYLLPAEPVRLEPSGAGHTPTALPAPSKAPKLPGRLTEISTTTDDGSAVRAWLALPADASVDRPAPLLLWIHGGPLMSWNAWTWRWNPWLMVARGYAVLLPDPALSTGYGLDFIRRGWGSWGGAPFTDLMAITDAAVARDDIDAARTAAMGGSFGGYMANWIAGHTDRFAAIVTHASLWALDQFSRTTDGAWYWEREMSAEMTDTHSPHHSADAITTPMLVIHGDKDYRVPIGEGLRLWRDLVSRAKAGDGGMPHKFLYYPDENHWILTPEHAKVWYGTVLAFLAHHVLGEEWEPPAILS